MVNTYSPQLLLVRLGWIFAEAFFKGKPSLFGAISGSMAGLIAVSPAAGYSGPMGAIMLGLVVGVVCLFFCTMVENALGYDNSLDVFGVHCIGGIIGALGTGMLVKSGPRRNSAYSATSRMQWQTTISLPKVGPNQGR